MNRSLTLTLWALGRLPSDQLPQVATDWLTEGLDSPSLRQLAGVGSPVMSEVGPLFEKVLAELEIVAPKKEAALVLLGRHYAQQIIEGAIPPYKGARSIWWEVTNAIDKPGQLLLTFVGAASELEDLPERTLEDGHDRTTYARELEATIVASARELLHQTAEPGAPPNGGPTAPVDNSGASEGPPSVS
jgi:hypothetical protein